MSGSATDWSGWAARRPPLSVPAACAWLAGAVAAAFPLVGMAAAEQYGTPAWLAAAVAAATCWFAWTLVLIATGLTTGPLRGFYAMLYGVLFGFAIPFGTGLVLSRRAPALAEAGVFGLVVVFYLVTLSAGAWLSVRLSRPPCSGASPNTRAD